MFSSKYAIFESNCVFHVENEETKHMKSQPKLFAPFICAEKWNAELSMPVYTGVVGNWLARLLSWYLSVSNMLFMTGLLTVNSWSCSHTLGGSSGIPLHCLKTFWLLWTVYLNTTPAVQVTFTISFSGLQRCHPRNELHGKQDSDWTRVACSLN